MSVLKPSPKDEALLFTENAFMFAALHEAYSVHIKRGSGRVPYMPSQWREGRGEPFDARITTTFTGDLFLQFKRSRLRVRKLASETHRFTPNYFCFKIDNDQHTDLVNWEKAHRNTYYVAPTFVLEEDLHYHFAHESVADNALAIDVSRLGYVDATKPHRFYFDRKNGELHSDVQIVEHLPPLAQVIAEGPAQVKTNLSN